MYTYNNYHLESFSPNYNYIGLDGKCVYCSIDCVLHFYGSGSSTKVL